MTAARSRLASSLYRLRSRLFALAVCCVTLIAAIALGCIDFSAAAATRQPQADGKFERSMPVVAKSIVTISNTAAVAVYLWSKNEVKVVAQAKGATVEESELRFVKLPKELEVTCAPSSADKAMTLTVWIPQDAVLNWKYQQQQLVFYELVRSISIQASPQLVRLSLSANAATVIYDAKNVFRFSQTTPSIRDTTSTEGGRGSFSSTPGTDRMHGLSYGGAYQGFGYGPPYVTGTVAGAEVLLLDGRPIISPKRQASATAAAIADGSTRLSRELRESLRELGIADDVAIMGNESIPQMSQAAAEGSLKLETYLVNLNVSVTDRAGRAITDLKQSDFSVFDEDVLQELTFFAPEKAPFNLILLIDMSGSVRNQVELMKEAALHFLNVIGSEDRVAVLTFTTNVQVVSSLTADREMLRERLRNLQLPAGGTSFYDALGYTLVRELASVKGQRNAVIVLTDGQDNALQPLQQSDLSQKLAQLGLHQFHARAGSYLSFEQLLEGVLEADAIVYPIHLKNTLDSVHTRGARAAALAPQAVAISEQVRQLAASRMQELAEVSGGRLFAAERIEDLKGVYEQVADELRTVYSLAYTPKNLQLDGKFKRLRVKLNRDGAAIRTRRGYYAQ